MATDTWLTNKGTGAAYWTFTPPGNIKWPNEGCTWERLPMSVGAAPYTIPAGDRLGLAVSLESKNTPADIPIIYDHPKYASRIEVDTNTPIDGG